MVVPCDVPFSQQTPKQTIECLSGGVADAISTILVHPGAATTFDWLTLACFAVSGLGFVWLLFTAFTDLVDQIGGGGTPGLFNQGQRRSRKP
jgi:hypothetical protein